MHERTQRGLARLMFVLCCAVPTCVTVLIVIAMATPWYANKVRSHVETELARDTGLIVRIGTYQRIAPSTVRIDDLRLIEPETNREVATVRQVDWVAGETEVSILLRQPELQSATLASTWRLLHDRFLCRPEHTGLPIRFAANDLTIHSSSGAMTLRDVDAWVEPTADAVTATIECLPATATSETPIQISVRRDRGGKIPSTDWTLDTHDTTLPCSALAEYLPGTTDRLGSGATFGGTMRWHTSADGWWVDVVGQFAGVSLDRVFEKQTHHLTGTATIQLERGRIELGKRIDLAGTVRARDGQIGRSLLLAANRHLSFDIRVGEGQEDVAYDRIAMRFNVNDTQMTLDGICHTEMGYTSFPTGIVMHAGGYPQVRSGSQMLPSLALMSTLAPSHSIMVPVSGQNAGLIGVLIPPSRPMPIDHGLDDLDPAKARIRTARDWSGGPVTGQPLQ